MTYRINPEGLRTLAAGRPVYVFDGIHVTSTAVFLTDEARELLNGWLPRAEEKSGGKKEFDVVKVMIQPEEECDAPPGSFCFDCAAKEAERTGELHTLCEETAERMGVPESRLGKEPEPPFYTRDEVDERMAIMLNHLEMLTRSVEFMGNHPKEKFTVMALAEDGKQVQTWRERFAELRRRFLP